MFCRNIHKSYFNSSCSTLTALVLLKKTIHLLNIPFILLQTGKIKLLANLVFLKLFHPVDAVSRTSSATPLKGRSTGSFSSSYSKANVAAASAAAKREDNDGNNATNATLDVTPGAPPSLPKASNHGNSTIAAVAAAQSEDDCSSNDFDDEYLESIKSSVSSLYTIPKPRPMSSLTVFEIGV